MIARMAEGGACRQSLEVRFMKLATRAAGRWVEARKIVISRRKRERCLEWRMLWSSRE